MGVKRGWKLGKLFKLFYDFSKFWNFKKNLKNYYKEDRFNIGRRKWRYLIVNYLDINKAV